MLWIGDDGFRGKGSEVPSFYATSLIRQHKLQKSVLSNCEPHLDAAHIFRFNVEEWILVLNYFHNECIHGKRVTKELSVVDRELRQVCSATMTRDKE